MIARRALLVVMAALAMAGPAIAQDYPARIIKLVVPYTPGSPNDVMARLLTQHLAPRLGQPIVIDNKPGSGTTIGTKAAAVAEPDGYTLLFVSSSITLDRAMKKKVDYDPVKDFAPVATVNTTYWLLAVAPTLPVTTMREFVAYTKAHPATINFAATQGTAAILIAEMFKRLSGADVQIIPYKGGSQALTDLVGGQVQVSFQAPIVVIAHVRDGRLRGIAITGETRLPNLPISMAIDIRYSDQWSGSL